MTRRRLRLVTLLPALLVPTVALWATRLPGAWLLPLGATAVVYPVMARLILERRDGLAAAAVLLWAASLAATIIAATAADPARVGAAVLHGPAYRDEMFTYVRTGEGRESSPGRFIPQHLLHLAAFAVLSAASAGLLGIAMGAVLVAYMSYYVGSLAAGSAPLRAALLGWPPWSILRVVAFILIGVALSRPLLTRLFGRSAACGGAAAAAPGGRPPRSTRAAWYAAAAALLLADVVLKWLLAPTWAGLLRPCLALR